MKLDLYRTNREWVYKDIPKKLFAEELIEDKGKAPNDYKFLCFNELLNNSRYLQIIGS